MAKHNDKINEAHKTFCHEYILDWNGSRAYKAAYPDASDSTARTNASLLLTNTNIQQYISELQNDLEKRAGISRLMVLKEHQKIAFNSIANMHNTWIERKNFEELTAEEKACISEIDTKVKIEYRYNHEDDKKMPVEVEYIRIKLFDKQKALDSIVKMLGYNEPEKTETEIKTSISNMTTEELLIRAKAVKSISGNERS